MSHLLDQLRFLKENKVNLPTATVRLAMKTVNGKTAIGHAGHMTKWCVLHMG